MRTVSSFWILGARVYTLSHDFARNARNRKNWLREKIWILKALTRAASTRRFLRCLIALPGAILIMNDKIPRTDQKWNARHAIEFFANQSSPVGCFYQLGASSTSTGKVLTNFIQTYTTSGNPQCSVACNNQNFNFYGTVNVGTTSVDCYCGDILNFVSMYFPRITPL